jgi:hypothetical protein
VDFASAPMELLGWPGPFRRADCPSEKEKKAALQELDTPWQARTRKTNCVTPTGVQSGGRKCLVLPKQKQGRTRRNPFGKRAGMKSTIPGGVVVPTACGRKGFSPKTIRPWLAPRTGDSKLRCVQVVLRLDTHEILHELRQRRLSSLSECRV